MRGISLLHGHVAREQQSDGRIGRDRAEGERRIAGAKNGVRAELPAQLFLEGGLQGLPAWAGRDWCRLRLPAPPHGHQ